VLDRAVAVFDGVAGVETQSETVWRQADKYGVPRICFINKLDRAGVRLICPLVDYYSPGPPTRRHSNSYWHEDQFKGVFDLIAMKA